MHPPPFPSVLVLLVLWSWSPAASAEEPRPRPDLRGVRVALDVGHSRTSPGARSARGRDEFSFNRETALAVADVLRDLGAKVILINGDGTLTGLWDRPRIAVRKRAHAYISIHHDSAQPRYWETWTFEGEKHAYCDRFSGYSVFCSKKNFLADQSRALALEVGRALRRAGLEPTLHHNEPIPGENRPLIDEEAGVYEFTDLIVAKAGRIPSILLECGVILHRDEELRVQTPEYRELLALAIADAMARARAADVIDAPDPERRGPLESLLRP